jgi:tetratricopeptide (TPR) repeat protein
VDPHFNYNMGVACREMGFLEDAIEQFQIAYHQGQSPLEAANLLGLCYKDKGMWEEARQAFEMAAQVNGISPEKRLEITYELGLLYKEQGKTEEALKLLRQINAVDPGVRKNQEGVAIPKNN